MMQYIGVADAVVAVQMGCANIFALMYFPNRDCKEKWKF